MSIAVYGVEVLQLIWFSQWRSLQGFVWLAKSSPCPLADSMHEPTCTDAGAATFPDAHSIGGTGTSAESASTG